MVQSYLDHPAAVRIIGGFAHLTNLMTGAGSDGEPAPPNPAFLAPPSSAASRPQFGYELRIEPHSFVAFRERH